MLIFTKSNQILFSSKGIFQRCESDTNRVYISARFQPLNNKHFQNKN